MQIAHMTKSEMGYSDYGHFGPILLFLNQYFNNFLPEFYVLCIALIWCTYDLLVYCAQVSSSFHLVQLNYPYGPIKRSFLCYSGVSRNM